MGRLEIVRKKGPFFLPSPNLPKIFFGRRGGPGPTTLPPPRVNRPLNQALLRTLEEEKTYATQCNLASPNQTKKGQHNQIKEKHYIKKKGSSYKTPNESAPPSGLMKQASKSVNTLLKAIFRALGPQ